MRRREDDVRRWYALTGSSTRYQVPTHTLPGTEARVARIRSREDSPRTVATLPGSGEEDPRTPTNSPCPFPRPTVVPFREVARKMLLLLALLAPALLGPAARALDGRARLRAAAPAHAAPVDRPPAHATAARAVRAVWAERRTTGAGVRAHDSSGACELAHTLNGGDVHSSLVLKRQVVLKPRAPAPRCLAQSVSSNALAARVRDALIEEEERPYQVWKEDERPLRINLDLLTYRARKLAQWGNRKGAIRTYKRCIELDPLDGRAWLGLAQIRIEQKRLKEAGELLRQGIKKDPTNAFLIQAYGKLHELLDKPDEALELYQRAVRTQPRHSPSWVALGLLLGKRKQWLASGKCLQIACTVAPKSYFAWQVMGQWHKQQGDLVAAREAFRRSLLLNNRNAATFHAWGMLEWR